MFDVASTTRISDFGCVAAALSSLQTVLGVTVDYEINGQRIAGNTSCTAGVYNSACLPRLEADDPNYKALITYQVLPNATLASTAKVTLKVCYSSPSARDRSWRKANNIIVVRRLFGAACLVLGVFVFAAFNAAFNATQDG